MNQNSSVLHIAITGKEDTILRLVSFYIDNKVFASDRESREVYESAVQRAVERYLRTEEGVADIRSKQGVYTWLDVITSVPEHFLEAQGFYRIKPDPVCIMAEPDEPIFWRLKK